MRMSESSQPADATSYLFTVMPNRKDLSLDIWLRTTNVFLIGRLTIGQNKVKNSPEV
jgi:hypothetical protein